jgi:hypothetical protein
MKFFVTAKIRTGARVSSRTVQAHKEYLTASLADGSIDCIYAFVGGGGFSISNADSADDPVGIDEVAHGHRRGSWRVEIKRSA